MTFEELIDCPKLSDRNSYIESRAKMDSVAKPLEGMGKFEHIIAKIAASQRSVNADIKNRALLVFCSDNGLTVNNVSQSNSSVTLNIANSIVRGTSSVAVMCRQTKTECLAVDVGMYENVEGTLNQKIRKGTNDISKGPAMTREETIKAIMTGAGLVCKMKERGKKILATGEAGIGNTTTSAAICAVLLKMPVKEATGRGAGLSDDGLTRKVNLIEKAIEINGLKDFEAESVEDVLRVLSSLGGFDIAAMTGVFLAAPLYDMPVVADGLISSVAALCAVRMNKYVKDYLIESHTGSEPAVLALVKELGLNPVIDAGMHIGEGTGAVMMFSLLDTALAVYDEAAFFDEIGVKKYEKL